MFKNYLKVAIRNLARNKRHFLLNIAGLTIGITIFILISLYIRHELSYDTFHKHADRIYRVTTDFHLETGKTMLLPTSPPQMSKILLQNYPKVVASVRLSNIFDFILSYHNRSFYESNLWYADSTFFDLFSFSLLVGNTKDVLKRPHSIVITKNKAKKYFADENPIGKTITINNEEKYTVTGILDDMQTNSHIKIDFLASSHTVQTFNRNNWGALSLITFIMLDKSETSMESFEKKFPDFIQNHIGERFLETFDFHLQPITSIHLHSDREQEYAATRDIKQIYLLSIIAFLVLLIACINLMNLSTARYAYRSKEVGMRKVLGAHRLQLIFQFFIESILLAFISLITSIGLIELIMPLFNNLIQIELIFDYTNNIFTLISIALVVGIISGSYPALYLSSFHPSNAFKSVFIKSFYRSFIRKGLVIFQFTITIAIFICVGIIHRQMNHIKNKRLGFNKEQILTIRIGTPKTLQEYELIKNELLQYPGIDMAAASSTILGQYTLRNRYRPEGFYRDNPHWIRTMYIDYDFIPALDMEIMDGRNFLREYTTDIQNAFILNESAVKHFGWNSAIGKGLIHDRRRNERYEGNVIGVVKDFHFHSLHQPIEPLVMKIDAERFYYINLKIKTDDISDIIKYLKKKWANIEPGYPLDYVFLDDSFDNLYQSEKQLYMIFTYFAIIAIIIACFGLFGLASFTAERRTKEIGIRKVLGASIPGIVFNLYKDFTKWILLANIIAWPVAYYAMNKWLQNFAYRINIGIWTFLTAGILALLIALLTVSYQAIRAATANPVEALRYE